MSGVTVEHHDAVAAPTLPWLAYLVLPALGGAAVAGATLGAALGWSPQHAGEFREHWWAVAAAAPSAALSLMTVGVVMLGAGVIVLVGRRRRGGASRRSPLLRGLGIVAVVALLWCVGSVRAQQSVSSFLSDPAASSTSASAQVRSVVAEHTPSGEQVRRSVTSGGVAAFGPGVLVATTLAAASSSGERVSVDYTMLVDPLTGRLEAAWYRGR